MTELVEVRQLLIDLHQAASNRLLERLSGLTDDEYLWDPGPGCWSVRPSGEGWFVPDLKRPHPEPPPLTTIAWLTWHLNLEIPPA
ncbi:MAG: DinB family protein, partial [bacterium]